MHHHYGAYASLTLIFSRYTPAAQKKLVARGLAAPVSQQEAWAATLPGLRADVEQASKDIALAANAPTMPLAVAACRSCANCGKINTSKLSSCSVCKATDYCSRDCQKADWGAHKGRCSAMRDAKAAAKAATKAANKEDKMIFGPSADISRNLQHMASIQEAFKAISDQNGK